MIIEFFSTCFNCAYISLTLSTPIILYDHCTFKKIPKFIFLTLLLSPVASLMSSNTTFRIVNAFCSFLILLFEELKTGGMTTVKKN